MCGIAGILQIGGEREETLRRVASDMTDALVHRGPDGRGLWADAEAGIALGHRRLAIVDLSPAGAQPMHSACGRCVIVYNGEVYNAAPLRAELEARGIRFKGHSDTEVVLESCATFGVLETARRLEGIFAFALYETHTRNLWLVRDQVGVKPLYWAWFRGSSRASSAPMRLTFGSELKALRQDPNFQPRVNPDALRAYFHGGYVPSPQCIYEDAQMLAPGHALLLQAGGDSGPKLLPYYALAEVASAGQAQPLALPDGEATLALDGLLRTVVESQMVSDVPLGAFLSGGIDSSTVVAIMQAVSARPVRTFSIGFREPGYNEAQHGAAVAAHLGTQHTALTAEPAHALALVPSLPDLFDEPFADSSQLPTYLVAKLTQAHVTVALSGDGGDELFCGYNRYLGGARLWQRLRRLPAPARIALAKALEVGASCGVDSLVAGLPGRLRLPQPADKMRKVARILPHTDVEDFYAGVTSHGFLGADVVHGSANNGGQLPQIITEALAPLKGDPIAWMQAFDALTYLPGDILTKVDRASMAVSLEARVPLLDPRVVAFAWSLPMELKVRAGTGKWLLRQVLRRYVPSSLTDRPKQGFSVPLATWLRGPLKEWASSLLVPAKLESAGLNAQPILAAWQAHTSSRTNNADALWDVLMYAAWHDRWL